MDDKDKKLSKAEKEAIVGLIEWESNKVAADKRCVSEHTQKNQIKAAMAKLEVHTQIGLVKEFFAHVYKAKFDINDARQMLSTALLALFIYSISISNFDCSRTLRTRASRSRTRNEITI